MKNTFLVLLLGFFLLPCPAQAAQTNGLIALNGTLWSATNSLGESVEMGFYKGKIYAVDSFEVLPIQTSKYVDFIFIGFFQFKMDNSEFVGIVSSPIGVGFAYLKGSENWILTLKKYSSNWRPD